jgi:hypothetical protein
MDPQPSLFDLPLAPRGSPPDGFRYQIESPSLAPGELRPPATTTRN